MADHGERRITVETPLTITTAKLRNHIAWWLCNLILRTIATPWYRKMAIGAIRYGLASAARDSITGDSWLDDVARSSRSAAEKKFRPPM